MRAILSGIKLPPAEVPNWQWAPKAGTAVLDGELQLASAHELLPEVVARAEEARLPFTLLLARPGPAARRGEAPVPASAADMEDLGAALSAAIGSDNDLMRAGAQHFAVVLPGRGTAVQREAMRLMRSAAAEGAPLFTWASARFPRDATTAPGLLSVATARLDGTSDEATGAAEPTPAFGRRSGPAIWTGVAAAALVGIAAFVMHGSGPGAHTANGVIGGQPGFGAASGGQSGGGSAGVDSSVGSGNGNTSGSAGSSGHAGQVQTGKSAGGTGSVSGGAALGGAAGGTQGSGSSGTGSSGTSILGNTGATTQQSGSGILSTTSSIPVAGNLLGGSSGVTSTFGNTHGGTGSTSSGSGLGSIVSTTTTTTVASGGSSSGSSSGSGSGSSSGSGSGSSSGSGSTQCSGLLNTVTCTVNGLLGGLGL